MLYCLKDKKLIQEINSTKAFRKLFWNKNLEVACMIIRILRGISYSKTLLYSYYVEYDPHHSMLNSLYEFKTFIDLLKSRMFLYIQPTLQRKHIRCIFHSSIFQSSQYIYTLNTIFHYCSSKWCLIN